MKKISINDCIKELDVVETSHERLRSINGGCTFTVGRCLSDGTGYIVSIHSTCGSYSSHAKAAINYAASSLKRGTIKKVKVANAVVVIA